jgi:hypothetical protein
MGLDLKKAEAQQMANARNTMAEREMELFKLEGAQGAAAQAQANMNAGISGAVQGLGTAVGYAGEAVPLYQQQKAGSMTAGVASQLGGLTGNRGTVEINPQMQQSGLTPEQMKYLSSFRYF